MNLLQQRIQKIEQDIQAACDRAGRNRTEITVIAVTKAVSAKRTSEVVDAGIHQLGENRRGRTAWQTRILFKMGPSGISSVMSRAEK